MTLVSIWFRPAPALETAWFGPDGRIGTMLARGTPPAAIPVIIGPPGQRGQTGQEGPQGPPPDDPGDLTLYFLNGLT